MAIEELIVDAVHDDPAYLRADQCWPVLDITWVGDGALDRITTADDTWSRFSDNQELTGATADEAHLTIVQRTDMFQLRGMLGGVPQPEVVAYNADIHSNKMMAGLMGRLQYAAAASMHQDKLNKAVTDRRHFLLTHALRLNYLVDQHALLAVRMRQYGDADENNLALLQGFVVLECEDDGAFIRPMLEGAAGQTGLKPLNHFFDGLYFLCDEAKTG